MGFDLLGVRFGASVIGGSVEVDKVPAVVARVCPLALCDDFSAACRIRVRVQGHVSYLAILRRDLLGPRRRLRA